MLHRFLGIGLVTLTALALVGKFFGVVPLLPPDDVTAKIAYVMSALSAGVIGYALLVLKPRAQVRTATQSVDQFWKTPANVTLVLPVWFLLEGAGVVAVVAYGTTGNPVAAAAMAVGVIAFWMSGPAKFA